jgi:DNA invertase Pin-like site-specific DNA recombinase
MLIGYARVSTVDQNLALQRDALTEAGRGKIFIEQMSGAVADRPALMTPSNSRAAATH